MRPHPHLSILLLLLILLCNTSTISSFTTHALLSHSFIITPIRHRHISVTTPFQYQSIHPSSSSPQTQRPLLRASSHLNLTPPPSPSSSTINTTTSTTSRASKTSKPKRTRRTKSQIADDISNGISFRSQKSSVDDNTNAKAKSKAGNKKVNSKDGGTTAVKEPKVQLTPKEQQELNKIKEQTRWNNEHTFNPLDFSMSDIFDSYTEFSKRMEEEGLDEDMGVRGILRIVYSGEEEEVVTDEDGEGEGGEGGESEMNGEVGDYGSYNADTVDDDDDLDNAAETANPDSDAPPNDTKDDAEGEEELDEELNEYDYNEANNPDAPMASEVPPPTRLTDLSQINKLIARLHSSKTLRRHLKVEPVQYTSHSTSNLLEIWIESYEHTLLFSRRNYVYDSKNWKGRSKRDLDDGEIERVVEEVKDEIVNGGTRYYL